MEENSFTAPTWIKATLWLFDCQWALIQKSQRNLFCWSPEMASASPPPLCFSGLGCSGHLRNGHSAPPPSTYPCTVIGITSKWLLPSRQELSIKWPYIVAKAPVPWIPKMLSSNWWYVIIFAGVMALLVSTKIYQLTLPESMWLFPVPQSASAYGLLQGRGR